MLTPPTSDVSRHLILYILWDLSSVKMYKSFYNSANHQKALYTDDLEGVCLLFLLIRLNKIFIHPCGHKQIVSKRGIPHKEADFEQA